MFSHNRASSTGWTVSCGSQLRCMWSMTRQNEARRSQGRPPSPIHLNKNLSNSVNNPCHSLLFSARTTPYMHITTRTKNSFLAARISWLGFGNNRTMGCGKSGHSLQTFLAYERSRCRAHKTFRVTKFSWYSTRHSGVLSSVSFHI